SAPVSLSIFGLLRLVARHESREPTKRKPRSARAGGVGINWCSTRSVPRTRAIGYSYEDEYPRDDDEQAGEQAAGRVLSCRHRTDHGVGVELESATLSTGGRSAARRSETASCCAGACGRRCCGARGR